MRDVPHAGPRRRGTPQNIDWHPRSDRADQLAYGVEKALEEVKDKLPADKVADVEGKVKSLREAIEANDTAAMATHSEALEAVMKEIAEASDRGSVRNARKRRAITQNQRARPNRTEWRTGREELSGVAEPPMPWKITSWA